MNIRKTKRRRRSNKPTRRRKRLKQNENRITRNAIRKYIEIKRKRRQPFKITNLIGTFSRSTSLITKRTKLRSIYITRNGLIEDGIFYKRIER